MNDMDLTLDEIKTWRKVFIYALPAAILMLFYPIGGMWERFPLLLCLGGYTYFTGLYIFSMSEEVK